LNFTEEQSNMLKMKQQIINKNLENTETILETDTADYVFFTHLKESLSETINNQNKEKESGGGGSRGQKNNSAHNKSGSSRSSHNKISRTSSRELSLKKHPSQVVPLSAIDRIHSVRSATSEKRDADRIHSFRSATSKTESITSLNTSIFQEYDIDLCDIEKTLILQKILNQLRSYVVISGLGFLLQGICSLFILFKLNEYKIIELTVFAYFLCFYATQISSLFQAKLIFSSAKASLKKNQSVSTNDSLVQNIKLIADTNVKQSHRKF
jgi:hypothetical protein